MFIQTFFLFFQKISVIASEELDKNPEIVWGKITKILKLPIPDTKAKLSHIMGNFGKLRVNSQEDNRTGVYHMERHAISKSKYQPGMRFLR